MIGNPRKRLPQYIVDFYDAFRFEWATFRGRVFREREQVFPEFNYMNLGCGTLEDRIPEGFLNVEHYLFRKLPWVDCCLDFRFPLPFASNQWRGIFMHHVLEHIPYKHACNLLAECHRILAPGGVLRVVVPDAEKVVRLYCSTDSGERAFLMKEFLPGEYLSPMEVVNEVFHSRGVQQAHHFGWDFETMGLWMRKAGFEEVCRMRAGESMDPKLQQEHMPWAGFSLYVDAKKAQS